MATGRQRFPTWWQGLAIMAGGIVLGFSSCAGFLSQINSGGGTTQALQLVLALGFLAGLGLVLVGFVLLIIGIARAIVNATQPPEPLPQFASPPQAAGAPHNAAAPVSSYGAISSPEIDHERTLRRFQIGLVVFMLLPQVNLASFALFLAFRPGQQLRLAALLVSYVLSQAPYAVAFYRTRTRPDRLGVAIAFSAACVNMFAGVIPLVHMPGLRTGAASSVLAWSGIFLLAHVVIAIFAWQVGRLAPPQANDAALLAAAFVGVVAYTLLMRFLQVYLLQGMVNGSRFHIH